MLRVLAFSILWPASMAQADSIPLHYDAALVAQGFPSPVMRVNIAGQPPAQFLIDTGASVHTLASWFVKEANLQASAAQGIARGSTGEETGVRVVRPVELRL